MPEFELDQDSISRAETMSSRLVTDLRMVSEERPPSEVRRDLFSERRYSEQAEGAPISDVLFNVSRMASQFSAARRWDGEMPFMRLGDGELAPISFSEFMNVSPFLESEDWLEMWDRYFPFPFPPARFWRDSARRAGHDDEQIVIADIRESEGSIRRNLSAFLSFRFAGIKKWAEWIRGSMSPNWGATNPSSMGPGSSPPPAVGPGGGLQVQVSCLTPGLSLEVAPAYFIHWVSFGGGHQTTPVAGHVLPGRYVFSGHGPMLPKRTKDPTVFCIPADYYPAIQRF